MENHTSQVAVKIDHTVARLLGIWISCTLASGGGKEVWSFRKWITESAGRWDLRNREQLAKGAYRHRIDIAGEDDWIKAATTYLEEHPPPQYASTKEIKEGALIILKAMSTATELSMEKVLVNKAKPRLEWWNNRCSRAVTDLEDCNNPEERSAALGRLRSAIRGAKRSRGDDLCTKVTNPEAVFKFTNCHPTQDQARLLRDAFFPATAPPADSSSPLGIPLHPTRPHHGITVDEISRALNSASNTSAPGAFGTNYRLLKWLFNARPGLLWISTTPAWIMDSTPNAFATRL
ncbi:hypothetical protein RHS01_01194 [Rhizoctonia solani]|uniref:Uncharacterized protein n=1 Tax=Rhizoctonia solani TaxID=456999 RepID=A0A8H7M6B4_9AGAM|nr:hypothetical protein RHS01_01194 [Rhizoctonia solani]